MFTQGRGAHQMFLPMSKYGHGQNVRGGGCYVRASAGPQTMPLPRLAVCNCLTTGYSFPLENLAGPRCPVSFLCHIPGLPLLNVLQVPGNTTMRAWPLAVTSRGLSTGRHVRSRTRIIAGIGMHSPAIPVLTASRGPATGVRRPQRVGGVQVGS